MRINQFFNLSQFMGWQSVVTSQNYWRQPELTLAITRSNMNVRRFISLVGIEMEPISADAKNRGHSVCLLGAAVAVAFAKIFNADGDFVAHRKRSICKIRRWRLRKTASSLRFGSVGLGLGLVSRRRKASVWREFTQPDAWPIGTAGAERWRGRPWLRRVVPTAPEHSQPPARPPAESRSPRRQSNPVAELQNSS